MKIIYLSSCCSQKKFDALVRSGTTKTIPQAQKYHSLMLKGLSSCEDADITAIVALPVNRNWSKKLLFSAESEEVENVTYHYASFINFPILRQVSLYRYASKKIRQTHNKTNDCVIVCDILNQSLAAAARKYGKKHSIPVIGIVTDVPGHVSGASNKQASFVKRKINNISEKFAVGNLAKYDGYLLLAQAMNDVVNMNHKPFIVIEGQCDSEQAETANVISVKAVPKVMLYAGGLHVEYGIERLVTSFLKCDLPEWELHIYGDGNYKDKLLQIANEHNNVKFFGLQPNSLVIQEQLKASLLVNPRPTDADFVKYSFPSKTLEYMVSGTPLLTTRLPSMPAEYYNHVYFIDDESENGFCAAISSVCSKSSQELHDFGALAKEFVLKEKSNMIQAKKFYDFILSFQNKKGD